ncbi:MAG: helix-turn-helix domain-containing protein [Marinicella sp.]
MKNLNAYKVHHIKRLSQVIESIKFYQNESDKDMGYISYEGIPNGVFEMVFHDAGELWQHDNSQSAWKSLEQTFIRGLHQRNYSIKMKPGTKLITVRFQPGAFKYIHDGNLNQYKNSEIPLADIWSNLSQALQVALQQQADDAAITMIIAQFITKKIKSNKRSVIDECVEQILIRKGQVQLEFLEMKAKLSTSHFRKRFREEVGLAPKTFIKIIRVNSMLPILLNNRKHRLVDIGYEYGYFDQSHFIKEFKSVVGCTPKHFRNSKSMIV